MEEKEFNKQSRRIGSARQGVKLSHPSKKDAAAEDEMLPWLPEEKQASAKLVTMSKVQPTTNKDVSEPGRTTYGNFEDLIESVGGHGRFQVFIYAISFGGKSTCAFVFLFMTFAGVTPDFWCVPSTSGANGSELNWMGNWTESELYKKCELSDGNVTCSAFRFAAGMRTVVSEWSLVCGWRWVSTTITSVQMGGVLLGAIAAGQAADVWGRRKVSLGFLIGQCLSCLINAFSPSWLVFLVTRFFCGVCAGGYMVPYFSLAMEFTDVRWRAFLGAIPAWQMGAGLMTLAGWLLRDWQYLNITTAVFTLPFIVGWWFMPDSVRWLMVQQRLSEAQAILQKAARVNRKPEPPEAWLRNLAARETRDSLSEIKIKQGSDRETPVKVLQERNGTPASQQTTLEAFENGKQGSNTVFMLEDSVKARSGRKQVSGVPGSHSSRKVHSYLDLFQDAALASTTCLLLFAWFSSGAVFYFLAFGAEKLSGSLFLNIFLMNTIELPGIFLTGFLNNKIGRRKTAILLYTLAGLCAVVVIVLVHTGGPSSAVNVLVVSAKLTMGGGWNALLVYSAENFPTVIRNIGFGACNMAARVGAILAPQLVFLYDTQPSVPYVIVALLMLGSSLCFLRVPETNDQALQDVLSSTKHHKDKALRVL